MNSSENFTITPTLRDGVLVIEPKALGDESNWFMESFNARDLSTAIGSGIKFIQDNHHSQSSVLCAACISKLSIPRESLYVQYKAAYLMRWYT